ncbi:MAG: hypothetical protein ACYTFT_04540 [Planctomycetota bacterium]|jgi:hypothetical protein
MARRRRDEPELELEPEPVVEEPPPPPQPKYQPGEQMILQARSGYWNYTCGPAYVYMGPRSIDEIYKMGEPCVLISDTIELDELQKIDISRVRGFIFEQGSTLDEEFYNFLQEQKRAAVIGCAGATYFGREGGWVIVDGVTGTVCFNPTKATFEGFAKVRAKGPPERERIDMAMDAIKQVVEDAVDRKVELEAQGKHFGDSHDHEMTKEQIVEAHENRPGTILQLLSGLPIKGAPDEHGHPYDPDAGKEPELIEPDEPDKPKRLTAAERREAAKAQREARGQS